MYPFQYIPVFLYNPVGLTSSKAHHLYEFEWEMFGVRFPVSPHYYFFFRLRGSL